MKYTITYKGKYTIEENDIKEWYKQENDDWDELDQEERNDVAINYCQEIEFNPIGMIPSCKTN